MHARGQGLDRLAPVECSHIGLMQLDINRKGKLSVSICRGLEDPWNGVTERLISEVICSSLVAVGLICFELRAVRHLKVGSLSMRPKRKSFHIKQSDHKFL